VLALAAGCASQDQIRDAITEVNQVFRSDYERILAEKGTRVFAARHADTFAAARAAMLQLGMRIDSQDPDLGYLNCSAPAPMPMSMEEWRETVEAELPRMREIAWRHVGPQSYFIRFEPQGLDVVINVTVVPVGTGTEISLTMRMRQITPPPSGMPRREYAPPTGVHKGLDKIWAQIERELGLARPAP
jgi:hypothetical protein